MPHNRRKHPTARHLAPTQRVAEGAGPTDGDGTTSGVHGRGGGRFSPVSRLVLGLVLMTVLVGCEEDMGQDDWLIVDNRTGDEVFVTDADADLRSPTRDKGTAGADILGSIGAEAQGFGAGGVERCDARALVAHGGSPDGPVVGRRPKIDGEACIAVWVIGS